MNKTLVNCILLFVLFTLIGMFGGKYALEALHSPIKLVLSVSTILIILGAFFLVKWFKGQKSSKQTEEQTNA